LRGGSASRSATLRTSVLSLSFSPPSARGGAGGGEEERHRGRARDIADAPHKGPQIGRVSFIGAASECGKTESDGQREREREGGGRETAMMHNEIL